MDLTISIKVSALLASPQVVRLATSVRLIIGKHLPYSPVLKFYYALATITLDEFYHVFDFIFLISRFFNSPFHRFWKLTWHKNWYFCSYSFYILRDFWLDRLRKSFHLLSFLVQICVYLLVRNPSFYVPIYPKYFANPEEKDELAEI